MNDATVDRYQRGRALIERLALSSRGTDSPRLQLTATQCADVVHFVRESEPFEPRTWFQDPRTGPSHVCGFMFVMEAVEDSLRGEKTVRGRS